MDLSTLLPGRRELVAQIQQLKTNLEIQKTRAASERKDADEQLSRLSSELERLRQREGDDRTLRAIEQRLQRENASLRSEVERLNAQVKAYHGLAETNWSLYERAQGDSRRHRETLEKISNCLDELRAIHYEPMGADERQPYGEAAAAAG